MGDQTDGMSQAQIEARKFEDDKRRIVESCFSKKDEQGQQIESYITHLRIVEDAAHPSTPPPPTSSSDNKKPRIIIVAVRRSGRVRVHKARENNTGTFSIGKTWNLDDLGPIQSFARPNPNSRQEQLFKEWAGDTGFTVSLGKPYYWQAATYVERQFFIGSLVKIYRKYTKLSPELIGFDPQEEQQFLGSSRPTTEIAARSPLQNQAKAYPPPAPSAGSAGLNQPQTRPTAPANEPYRAPSRNGLYASAQRDGLPSPAQEPVRAPSRDGNRAPSRNGLYATSSRENLRSPNGEGVRAPSREGFRDLRKPPSREQMRRKQSGDESIPPMPGQFEPPQSSQTSLRATSRPSGTYKQPTNGVSPTPSPRNEDALRRIIGSPDAISTPKDRERFDGQRRPSDVRRQSPSPSPFQEASRDTRRPPPMPSSESLGQKSDASESASKFSTPLATPEARAAETRSSSRPRRPSNAAKQSSTAASQPSSYFATTKADKVVTPAPDSAAAAQITIKKDDTAVISPPMSPPSDTASEEHRPGLGPMIKKKSAKDIAGTFRKAALAANAFKPRAGGAGERLMAKKDAPSDEPDGITSVVPAPLLRGISTESSRSGVPEAKDVPTTPTSDVPKSIQPKAPLSPPSIQLQRKATEDMTSPQKKVTQPKKEVRDTAEVKETRATSPDKTRSRSPGRRRRQMQEARITKYCDALGIDSKVLEGRGGDFDDLLTELGWDGRLEEGKTVDDLQADIRREIGRAQATGWLGHIEQQEAKRQQLATLFDKAIEECEDLDGLLTLYQHELATLADDVAYIEAQGQGLQVQTANQKLLQKEMENLLRTISISPAELRDLREASLDSADGLEAAEQALSILYKAMLTIDPDIRQNRKRQADVGAADRGGVGVYADAELGQMRAVKEKKDDYREETQYFLKRLNQYMNMAFKMAEQRTSEALERNKPTQITQATKLITSVYEASRQELWMYNPLMLFVREVNSYEWQTLISLYEVSTKSLYQDQFRDNVFAWKKITRRPTGDEQDLLFTGQEKDKENDGLATAARKLTVKRGKTVRVTGTIRPSTSERQDGKVEPYDAFAGVLDEQASCIAEEQNFIVEFFHLTSLSTADFADVVSANPPTGRRLPTLAARQNYDPDRDMAKTVEKAMDNMYSFWPGDLQNLVEWTLKSDQLQGVGLLYTIEKKLSDYEETNQEYITRTLQRLHERLLGLFHRFVDEQIRGIEDTKVKIKKRKGVISFMRVFPAFVGAVEAMIQSPVSNTGHHESLEIRFIVNDAYTKINKAMFESLNFIAKEIPGSTGQGPGISSATASGDPEDKEALNYHILMIENMNHYLEEVDPRSNVVLEEFHEKASHEFYDHMKQYIDAVIRRPLGKLLDFLESTEALMKSSADASSPLAAIATKPSHSRSTAKKVTSSYDIREIRKGVETLKKRVEKHFGDVDDPGVGRSLVVKVYGECNARYSDAHDRMRTIIDKVYEGQGAGLELDWRKEEVTALFRR